MILTLIYFASDVCANEGGCTFEVDAAHSIIAGLLWLIAAIAAHKVPTSDDSSSPIVSCCCCPAVVELDDDKFGNDKTYTLSKESVPLVDDDEHHQASRADHVASGSILNADAEDSDSGSDEFEGRVVVDDDDDADLP